MSYHVRYHCPHRFDEIFSYTDVERGERGSSEEHLTVTQFKVEQEQKRLAQLEQKVEKQGQILQSVKQKTKTHREIAATCTEIEQMGQNTLFGKVQFTPQEASDLKELAMQGITARAEVASLKQKLAAARRDASVWKIRYEKLKEQTHDFLEAIKRAPELVKAFLERIRSMEPKLHRSTSQKEKDRSI